LEFSLLAEIVDVNTLGVIFEKIFCLSRASLTLTLSQREREFIFYRKTFLGFNPATASIRDLKEDGCLFI